MPDYIADYVAARCYKQPCAAANRKQSFDKIQRQKANADKIHKHIKYALNSAPKCRKRTVRMSRRPARSKF